MGKDDGIIREGLCLGWVVVMRRKFCVVVVVVVGKEWHVIKELRGEGKWSGYGEVEKE